MALSTLITFQPPWVILQKFFSNAFFNNIFKLMYQLSVFI